MNQQGKGKILTMDHIKTDSKTINIAITECGFKYMIVDNEQNITMFSGNTTIKELFDSFPHHKIKVTNELSEL